MLSNQGNGFGGREVAKLAFQPRWIVMCITNQPEATKIMIMLSLGL